MNITDINGHEIIDFLNDEKYDENKEIIYNGGVWNGPFVFEAQHIMKKDEYYVLIFSSYYNNWGTNQLISGNTITIYQDGNITTTLQEPFDGDESSDELEETLTNWLKTHTFLNNIEKAFYSLKDDAVAMLMDTGHKDADKMQIIIDLLKKAKTYIK